MRVRAKKVVVLFDRSHRVLTGCNHAQRDHGDVIVQWIAFVSRVDDPEVVEGEVGQRCVHGSSSPRRIGVLDFEADSSTAGENEEIQLGATVSGPEIRISGVQPIQNLLDGEPLPGGAELGMPEHLVACSQLEK